MIYAEWNHVLNPTGAQRKREVNQLQGARQGFKAELMKIIVIVY